MRGHYSHNVSGLLRACEAVLAADDAYQKSKRSKDGEFHYIPLDAIDFCQDFTMAAELSFYGGQAHPKFIDVGCGIGSKLILAASCGAHYGVSGHSIYGIEKDPRYLVVAKKLLAEAHVSGATLIKNDFFNLTFEDFDIVYFYGPLMDHEKEVKLEKLIVETIKPGAYIIGHYARYLLNGTHNPKDPKVIQISDHIWQKLAARQPK